MWNPPEIVMLTLLPEGVVNLPERNFHTRAKLIKERRYKNVQCIGN
jgi:hypothetical protein